VSITLIDYNMFGKVDKVQKAIDRLRAFEPPEGYYLAFSGGKDSQCIYHLALEAGVKFDAHYHVTTVDPPELIYFIQDNYPDVIFDKKDTTMWKLIPKKGLPTRLRRYCCQILKEDGGKDRIVVTGVRWAESNNRTNNRQAFEVMTSKKSDTMLFSDNDEGRQMFETCTLKGKRIVNPIIDWLTEDVWEYIHTLNLKYCKLYDEGFERLGCVGCPMAGERGMIKEFERWPKYKEAYKRAIARFIPGYLERCKQKGREPMYTTVDEWFNWWIYGKDNEDVLDGQEDMF
jgi:phosphoadenosine phosphosulfate reductase